MRMTPLFVFLGVLLSGTSVIAQAPAPESEPEAPKPVLIRSSLEPGTRVFVGQSVTFYLEVMTNTWFTKAPRYPELRLPHAVCLELSQFGVNYSERIQGETYAVQRKEYVIFPQRPERFTVPALSVDIVYARPGEPHGEVTLNSPPQEFTARIPEQARGVDTFVTTPRLQVVDGYDRGFEGLRVGDSVSRTVTMTADDSVGMLLPPLEFVGPEGLGTYPESPRLEDHSNRGVFSGKRIESVTYVMEREGEYSLPELRIFWFDLGSGTLRTEVLEAVDFSVAPNPDLEPEMLASLEDEATVPEGEAAAAQEHRLEVRALLYLGLGVIVLLSAVWVFLVPYLKRFRIWLRERRRLRAGSEQAYFLRFRRACRSRDVHQIMQGLLSWLDRAYHGPGAATVDALVQGADDIELKALAAGLKEALYRGGEGEEAHAPWSASDFYAAVARARKRLLHRTRAAARPPGLQPLNP